MRNDPISSRIDGFDYIRLAHELEDSFNRKIDLVSRRAIKSSYLPFVEKFNSCLNGIFPYY